MKTIDTNNNNDIFTDGSGNLALAADMAAVQHVCENAALTLKGEIQLDTQAGIPYFDIVFGAHPNLQRFKKYITDTLESVENVLAVSDFQLDYSDGILKYSVVITTPYGEAVLNG